MSLSFVNHEAIRDQFYKNPGTSKSEILGDSNKPIDPAYYGVRLKQVKIAPGSPYWRVLGVHHLTPDENRGKHNVYVDVMDEHGELMRHTDYPLLRLKSGPNSEHKGQDTLPLQPFDKLGNEAMTNVVIDNKESSVWVSVEDDKIQDSDTVSYMCSFSEDPALKSHFTQDQPTTDGHEGNTPGHHSYYVLFQKSTKQSTGGGNPTDVPTGQWGKFSTELTAGLTQMFNDAVSSEGTNLTPVAFAQQVVNQVDHNYVFFCNTDTPASPSLVYIYKPSEGAAVYKKMEPIHVSL